MDPPTSPNLEQLQQQLHEANEHYHASRKAWEKSLDSCDEDHAEHVEQTQAVLREAEQAVEAVEARIQQAMNDNSH